LYFYVDNGNGHHYCTDLRINANSLLASFALSGSQSGSAVILKHDKEESQMNNFKNLVLCGLLIAGLATTQVLAADRITSDIKVTPEQKLTARETHTIAQAAGRMLRHVFKARKDISQKNEADAAKQVGQAITLAEMIEKTLPNLEVTASFKTQDMSYKDEEVVKQFTVPILSEIDETLSFMKPGKKERKEGVKEDELATTGWTGIFVNVDQALEHLKKAAAKLTEKDLKGADEDLSTIQENVIFAVSSEEIPIAKEKVKVPQTKEKEEKKK